MLSVDRDPQTDNIAGTHEMPSRDGIFFLEGSNKGWNGFVTCVE